jgi:hypothetical protein
MPTHVIRACVLTASQGCTRSLRSNGTGNADPSPMAIAFGANKIEPTATAVLFLECQCMLDLTELESGEIIGFIASAMVSAKYVKRFLIAASRYEPSYIELVSGYGVEVL